MDEKKPRPPRGIGRPKAPRERPSPHNSIVSPKAVWVTARIAQAILGTSSTYLAQLKRLGKFTMRANNEYNLAEVLERQRILLNKSGQLVQEIEAVCIREFKTGKLPDEVIIEHGYAYEIVKQAWDHHVELRKDPEVARIEAERQQATKKQGVARCRDCVRTFDVAQEDSLRIVRETTGDPGRTDFTLVEERACLGLELRCSSCRMLKATASIDSIRARLRVLAIAGMPKPIDVDREMPLPSSSSPPNAASGERR